MPNTIIIGSGSYIPTKVIGREHFMDSVFYTDEGDRIDKPNAEIIQKFVEITEIENRRYMEDGEFNSDLGYRAAKEAIYDAQIDQEEIDYIIYASNFGEVDQNGMTNFMPSMSARVKNKLGIKNRKCVNYDMIFGCPGWVEAMILADTLIKAKKAKLILVVGSEALSRVTDAFDRNKMIFADGAGAVVVKATDDENVGIIADSTICDNDAELNYLENAPSLKRDEDRRPLYIRMHGRKIYEYALKNVPDAIKETIDKAGLTIDDIDKILIHQANAKMDYAMISRLHKLYGKTDYDHAIAPMTIQEFGNSSVATIPTMFDLIIKGEMKGHTFKEKGNIVFASVGAGMNINAIVYRFP
ncbi:ketoacyl-ACP synthase III [Candidatus Kaistella beijingensis]|uniref:3-oxoacyl-ACP synthase III family protein n=1 Tax=Candidatus Kaistella beijingensis TaxID=2820270 RepID=UPI001AC4BB13|nr:ketoacyl-ACP synthase III [Candidatus Kaistella beijingensis]MBN8623738.1 ketoacyl-ACP synthase III [Flavobacteriales bacterium]MCA0392418.1 ketoacyl-ACP synthase III [Bacteroidota bacterium]UBB89750.1 ketoacyl-ACP synthase III [Candidatus Kaistella beijingensis]HOB24380.1 ketoacyl-ACP synthase III [Kaistella sp.]